MVRKVTGFPYKNLGVKVEINLNGVWTDITAYARLSDGISISPFGRTNETSGMQAGQAALTLNNATGRFSPGNTAGAYYPYVQLNTQVRISVNDSSVNGTSYSGYRFWGEVGSWPAAWDVSQRDSYVQVTAYGIWQRLSASTRKIGSPYTRWNTQLSQSNTFAAYWPMEDGSGSTVLASVTPSTAANMVIVTGTPTLSSISNFRGSDAIPQLNGAELSGTITTALSPSQINFRFAMMVPTSGDTGAAGGVLARLHLGGTLDHVDVSLAAAGGSPFTIAGYNSVGTQLFSKTLAVTTWGIPLLCQVGLVHSGSTITYSLSLYTQASTTVYGTTSGTITGSLSDATSVIFSPGGSYQGTGVGQAMVIYANPSIGNDALALGGWQGEFAGARFLRICSEQGIPAVLTGSSTSGTTMGPQADDTLAAVLQQIEDTDGGFLSETRSQFGLGYRTLASLQNQSAAVTVNYAAQQLSPPLVPVTDATLTRNDITITNYDGYALRTYLASGARSIQSPPSGVGTGYEYARNVSSTSHAQVNALAQQILYSGTVSDPRYPTVTVNLARTTTASLFSSVPSLNQGDYLALSNMPAYGGAASQKQLVWGWSESIGDHAWTLTFNTIPEAPFESAYSPGTPASGQVPAQPTTISQSGSVSGAQIAGIAVTGGLVAPGIPLTAPYISGGTIEGGSVIADGTSGELLVYSGTPAAGNLLVAVSGAAGNDNSGNPYSSALTLAGQSSTPAAITGSAILYGTNAGSLQTVDGMDGNTYQTQHLTQVLTSNVTCTSTTPTTIFLANTGARSYRVHAWLLITANSNGALAVEVAGPGSSGGQFSVAIARATTFYDLANFGMNSLTGLATMVSGSSYVAEINGIMANSVAGSVGIQAAVGSTPNSLTVVRNSFFDLSPI